MTAFELLAMIVALGRQRRWLLRAEVQLSNEIGAVARMMTGALCDAPVDVGEEASADDVEPAPLVAPRRTKVTAEECAAWGVKPLADSRDHVRSHRKRLDRAIEKQVEALPIWREFAAEIRGLGPLSLGLLLAETGDLAGYASPARVWKRMGLAVGNDGRAQRRIANDPEAAIAQGYSPRRRSTMHVIGENLLRQQGTDGAYRLLYDARKAYELARAPEMRPIVTHKRALRFMEKRLLRDLWRAWRRQAVSLLSPVPEVPDGATHVEVATS